MESPGGLSGISSIELGSLRLSLEAWEERIVETSSIGGKWASTVEFRFERRMTESYMGGGSSTAVGSGGGWV